MKTKQAIEKNLPYGKHFGPELLVIERGKGSWLFDAAGNKYLDFGAGIAVNALGYGRRDFARTVFRQTKKLIHISNLFANRPALELGRLLVASGPFAAVHFGNSGTEANEAALKFGRLYALRKKGAGHHKILCFSQGFHGRTYGALSATPNPKYQEPFKPLLPGIVSIPYNDPKALAQTLDESFAAVIVEVIQGEGGLSVMTTEFAQALNSLCQKYDIILIADEVQTGLGRIGEIYASLALGLKPDIITLAKPLAGGLPLSATLFTKKINDLLEFGEHGTTFGGGPVTAALGLLVWKIINSAGFLDEVKKKSSFLDQLLMDLKEKSPLILSLRGKGLLRGLELATTPTKENDLIKQIITAARHRGLLILRSGSNVIRIAPPLTISKKELVQGVKIIAEILKGL